MSLEKDDLLCRQEIGKLIRCQSPFYAQVLKFWFEFYSLEPAPEYINSETIWNRFIKIYKEVFNNADHKYDTLLRTKVIF